MSTAMMQNRCDKLVEREVLCHVGGLIDEIQEANNRASYFEWTSEAFECSPTDAQIDEYLRDNDLKDTGDNRTEAVSELSYPEIYEYYAVSSWLAEKLRAEGEPVAEFGITHVWGRGTTGQAIALDGVIEMIVEATDYAVLMKDESVD